MSHHVVVRGVDDLCNLSISSLTPWRGGYSISSLPHGRQSLQGFTVGVGSSEKHPHFERSSVGASLSILGFCSVPPTRVRYLSSSRRS